MNVEQLTNLLNEKKQKANIINNLAIDFENIRLITPKIILSSKDALTQDVIENGKFILTLIDNVDTELKTLKIMLTNIISE